MNVNICVSIKPIKDWCRCWFIVCWWWIFFVTCVFGYRITGSYTALPSSIALSFIVILSIYANLFATQTTHRNTTPNNSPWTASKSLSLSASQSTKSQIIFQFHIRPRLENGTEQRGSQRLSVIHPLPPFSPAWGVMGWPYLPQGIALTNCTLKLG